MMRMSNPRVLPNLTSSIFQHVHSPREHWWSAIFAADRHRIIRLGESLSPYLLPPPPFTIPPVGRIRLLFILSLRSDRRS